MKKNLRHAVEHYLSIRRSFGFALVKDGFELRGLLRYAERIGHTGPLTAQLALRWAQQPKQADRVYWAMRLDIVRRFARFWMAYDPRTEIPPGDLFGPTCRRRAVHVYTSREVSALLKAASDLGGQHPLRGSTFCTLLGLLDCTGLRIGEALGLSDRDIDWSTAVLTIRHAKYGHARLIPVQSSTLEALQQYRRSRDKAVAIRLTTNFFVTVRGKPLGYRGVSDVFRGLCRGLGWTQEPIPRLHDLRHTFAVRTLLRWYRSGEAVQSKLWTLSTYLGHRHLADTYWYLSAVPELMQLCQQRFATAQAWASGGRNHD
jgi:integrase/recombinase XerC